MHALLHRIGLTKLAALTLVGYYVFFLTLQQFLPADQSIFRWLTLWQPQLPFMYIYLTIFCVGTLEIVRIGTWRSRPFWIKYACVVAAGALNIHFLTSFGSAKSLIPTLNPYYLDPILQKIDIVLHGGTSPFEWLAPWLYPARVNTLNLYYVLVWSVVMMMYLTWQIVEPESEGRTLFLSSFIMLWIVAGIVFATLFSSVGPTYYSLFYHDTYSAMNDALVVRLYGASHMMPMDNIPDIRQLLLHFSMNDRLVDINGISSMPSVHTAIALLLMLHSFHYARPLLTVTIPLALCTFVGSFVLGWHYMVDTYVSAALVYAVWHLNKQLYRKGA